MPVDASVVWSTVSLRARCNATVSADVKAAEYPLANLGRFRASKTPFAEHANSQKRLGLSADGFRALPAAMT